MHSGFITSSFLSNKQGQTLLSFPGLETQQNTTSLPSKLTAEAAQQRPRARSAVLSQLQGTRDAGQPAGIPDPSPRSCSQPGCLKLMVPAPKQDTESSSTAGTALWDHLPADVNAAPQPEQVSGSHCLLRGERRERTDITAVKLKAKLHPRCKHCRAHWRQELSRDAKAQTLGRQNPHPLGSKTPKPWSEKNPKPWDAKNPNPWGAKAPNPCVQRHLPWGANPQPRGAKSTLPGVKPTKPLGAKAPTPR